MNVTMLHPSMAIAVLKVNTQREVLTGKQSKSNKKTEKQGNTL